MSSLRHEKSADFLAEKSCYNHNFVLICNLCSIHIPLFYLLPFLPCPINFIAGIQASGSAIKNGCMPVVGEPQSSFLFFFTPGILEKAELSDVSFTRQQFPVLHSKAWENFRSIKCFSEMPSREKEVMLAASTSEISLDVSIWPKPLVFGKLLPPFTVDSH